MKSVAQDIVDTFRALGSIPRLAIITVLSERNATRDALHVATGMPVPTLKAELLNLERDQLIMRTGGKEERQTIWRLHDRVTVDAQTIYINASGLAISVARSLKEES